MYFANDRVILTLDEADLAKRAADAATRLEWKRTQVHTAYADAACMPLSLQSFARGTLRAP